MAYRQKEYNYNDKLTKNQNLLMDKLYKMRMSGMAEAFENQLMNPNSGLESFETRFSEIINHEWLGRENKKFNRLLKQATLKYPAADLDSSLYDPERQLNTHVIINGIRRSSRCLIRLCSCDNLSGKNNIFVVFLFPVIV